MWFKKFVFSYLDFGFLLLGDCGFFDGHLSNLCCWCRLGCNAVHIHGALVLFLFDFLKRKRIRSILALAGGCCDWHGGQLGGLELCWLLFELSFLGVSLLRAEILLSRTFAAEEVGRCGAVEVYADATWLLLFVACLFHRWFGCLCFQIFGYDQTWLLASLNNF